MTHTIFLYFIHQNINFMAFKHRPPKCVLASHDHVYVRDLQTSEEFVDGDSHSRVVVVQRDLLNPDDFPSLPSRAEYSVENQMAAGIPLQEIPGVRSSLNPSDAATCEQVSASVVESDMDYVVNNLPTE